MSSPVVTTSAGNPFVRQPAVLDVPLLAQQKGVALAVLKLPTGALSSVLGLLLMRGGFVPGLTALDTTPQIIAWAVVLGASQQLVTGLVDRQAQTVLDSVGNKAYVPAGPS